MNKLSSYLLVILATISVGLLGHHAYTIATDTFSFSFIGQESQTSNIIRVALAKPWIQFGSSTTEDALDTDALLGSIKKNGKSWNPTISGEGYMMVSGEYMEIVSNQWEKNDTITVSATEYNINKKTGWKLPRDITSTYSEQPKKLEIQKIGLPRDMTYQVKMTGYKNLKTNDLRWYIKNLDENGNGCNITTWNAKDWKKVTTNTLLKYSNENTYTSNEQLNIEKYPSSACIVVGVAGDFEHLRYEKIQDFVATGAITDAISPEYDMQSRIEFRFSTDIFADSGTLYSDTYMDHRHNQKIEFLKKLSILPGITVTENDLELSPNKAVIYANLLEGKKYTINLDSIKDIYGRETSSRFEIIPESKPSLTLKIIGNKTIIKYGDAIPSKLYYIKPSKKEFEIKLCQISLDGFSRVERMNEVRKKEHISALYELLKSNEVSNCTKKTIVLSDNGYIADFDINSLLPKGLNPGLYILAFQNSEDIDKFDKWVAPRVFSVVDTHITMKIDTSGKMQFLATDIRTGEPRPNQDITLRSNIAQLFKQNWNNSTNTYDIEYTPLSAASWGSGIVLGRTQADGTLEKNKIALENGDPYSFTSEWWGDYEGRYNSFVAISKSGNHFGYVVSTWNDGITGWNFGMKESDYGWDNRPLYSAYIHTDRRLYLPGETVHIKAILRKNETSLTIPENETFEITVNDPEGKIVSTTRVKSNAYGSVTSSLEIGKDSPLGAYSIGIQSITDRDNWISNSYANFQVEIFKNPTFTAEVKLSSPEVTNGILSNIRKAENNDPNTNWYENTYKSNFNIEGLIKAKYYNGTTIKSVPFSYRIYKSPHYDLSYWTDCFWGCYYEPTPEFYTEGTGSIDSDGFGIFRTSIEFSSFSDDYIYTAEVTIVDPLSGETVTTPGTLLVGLGAEYKMYDIYNPLQATLQDKIIKPGEKIQATIDPKYGKWDQSLKGKYSYELVHRTYTSEKISTLRGEQTPITHTIDDVSAKATIEQNKISIDTKGFESGEYFLRIIPITKNPSEIPKESISESLVYITGDFISRDNLLRVIPEKTIYKNSETATILITTPFSSGGHLYITRERGGIIDHEYVTFSGSTYARDYQINDSFYPNVYIGAIAFPKDGSSEKGYAVGYSEIIMDMTEKKGTLDIKTDKETYKNRETVTVDITLGNKNNSPEEGEIEVMVIDESLIRLLGNIDLDIIPKFFQKYPFTMKTALTAIGIERNRFLSRKGSNGGSGDKGGDGTQISSRTLFQNTAYYNASIITDSSGKAKITFELPDNVTDYRIIAIGQTKSSRFSVAEKTISVRRDYTIETHAPTLVYGGDTTTITASAFNSTKKITPVTLSLEIGTGGILFKKSETLILNPSAGLSQDFVIDIGKNWIGNTPYTIRIEEKGVVLDSITKFFNVAEPPVIINMSRVSGFTNTGVILNIPSMSKNTNPDSKVIISISDSPLQNPKQVIDSMISYPYGCIEQTISSTMPNGVAIKLASSLDIKMDFKQAEKNLSDGVAKILRMQDPSGGWRYWETDTNVNAHVTPYVIRSLYEFKNLGVRIPDIVFTNGLEFIANTASFDNTNGINDGGSASDDNDLQAEIFATLSQGKHPKSQEIKKNIDLKKLSRHGYLMYHLGLFYEGKFDENTKKNLETRMNLPNNESYWYWDDTADRAIYARLLLKSNDRINAGKIISDMLKGVDLESYFVSTQTKIQLFMALTEFGNQNNNLSGMQIESGILKIPVKVEKNTHRYSFETRRSLIGSTLDIKNIEGNSTIYYDISLRDEPLNIFQAPAVSHPEIGVTRIFEKIDESKGIDSNGQFISATPNTNGIFKKGDLYRVRIKVTPKSGNNTKYYLTLEDFIPGGWRPIRGVFNTESSSTTDASSEYGYWNGWTHVEAQEDRILATQDYVWRTDYPYTYTYYIRPEYIGTYLLPPVTAYYMYQGDIHATGKYEKIIVQ
ncbi:hypothetical protein HOO68_03555 [Candidatus Gracilibacteria bacterium]|nr:hypothetical protein [Candidatus Gracilibacteria bacterium]